MFARNARQRLVIGLAISAALAWSTIPATARAQAAKLCPETLGTHRLTEVGGPRSTTQSGQVELECTYDYEETGERGQSINANVVNIGVYWYLPGDERGYMAPRFCARGDDAEFGRDSNPRVVYPLVGERYIEGYYRSLREGPVLEQARALTVELVQAMGEFAAVCPGVSLPTASMDCIDLLLISDDLEELDDVDKLADELESELAELDENLDIEEPDLEGLVDELDALELDEDLDFELEVCPGA